MPHNLTFAKFLKQKSLYAPAWTAEGLTTGTIPAAFRATAAHVAPDLATRLNEIIRLEGITVLGYPLGSDDYCRGVLNKLREKICEDLPTLEQLDDGLAYLHLLRFCLIPRLSYALRAPSTTISRPCAEAFDTAILDSLRKYAGLHAPAYKTREGHDATPEQVTRWLRAFTFGDTDEGFLGLPLMELTAPVAYLSAHTRFIRWVTTLVVAQSLPDVMTPGTSSLGPLKVLRDCQQLLRDSGLKETSDVDDDGRVDPGQKTAPTLVSLAELPSNGAATQDDFPSQRQLARHLARRSGPAASLRDLPAGDQLPLIVEALARGRAAGKTPYKTDLAKGTTWSRDRNGAPLDPTRQLHYRPMAALFHLWVPTAARLRRDELALTLCQWAGMVVAPARDGGRCPGCGQALDPCGHHLQVCRKRASFLWCHQIWQGFFTDAAANIPGVKVVTSTAHGLPHETTTRGKQPDALITVPQPPGDYGPLLYPTNTAGAAGLTLDFTVVHPVGRNGTEYTCNEHALHRAYRAKVTKHHEWLQAKNYWFVPVVAATTGELHPATLRLLYDFARLKTDAAEQHAAANTLRSPLTPEQLCQRRGATFARLRMEAQLYCLRAAATRLTGKYWAAPFASSLLARSRARARCGAGAFAPAPAALVRASR